LCKETYENALELSVALIECVFSSLANAYACLFLFVSEVSAVLHDDNFVFLFSAHIPESTNDSGNSYHYKDSISTESSSQDDLLKQ
jgi:hypothetical protein